MRGDGGAGPPTMSRGGSTAGWRRISVMVEMYVLEQTRSGGEEPELW